MMRLWLAKAGVFGPDGWAVDEPCLRALLGSGLEDFGVLARFTSQQRAFLLALGNTGVRTPQRANEIVKLASATYGVQFPEKSLPKEILHALVASGYITAGKTTTGRGAKPFMVAPTAKMVTEVDFIFRSQRLVFSRWQVQCKNTAKVSLDDVAKEVGRRAIAACRACGV
jgi:site-specific DNA-methyltransferase (cytosine-N4-specific)